MELVLGLRGIDGEVEAFVGEREYDNIAIRNGIQRSQTPYVQLSPSKLVWQLKQIC